MSVQRLPVRPDLDQLKHQAKDLLTALRAGDPASEHGGDEPGTEDSPTDRHGASALPSDSWAAGVPVDVSRYGHGHFGHGDLLLS